VQVLLCAANAFTAHALPIIVPWARRRGLLLVATDVLRVHPRKPGNATPLGRHGSTEDIHIGTAVKDFTKALDICMHAEKRYLEIMQKQKKMDEGAGVGVGVATSEIDPTTLCWGHVLARAQGAILYPEEWYYLQHAQAQPHLDDNYQQLKQRGGERGDFALLHLPLSKFLFAAFDRVLQARRQELLRAISASLPDANANQFITTATTTATKSNSTTQPVPVPGTGVSSTELQVPERLASLIGSLDAGFDHVCLAGTSVGATELAAKRSGTAARPVDEVCATLSTIQPTLTMFGQPQSQSSV